MTVAEFSGGVLYQEALKTATNQTILMNIVRIIPYSCFVLSTCNGLLSFLENFERCMNVPCDPYKCILLINRMYSCMMYETTCLFHGKRLGDRAIDGSVCKST